MTTILLSTLLLQGQTKDMRYSWGRSNRAAVVVNGQKLDARAIIRDNRIQVPMRAIFEALGAYVTWYPENHKVVALKDDKVVSLVLNENFAYNPKPVVLDYPPRMMGGTIYVPLKFVAQSLGAKVRFDRKRKTAHVDLPMDREVR